MSEVGFRGSPCFGLNAAIGGGTVAGVPGSVVEGFSGRGIHINDAARKISPRKLRTMNVELRIS
jgi:hypothetical protein